MLADSWRLLKWGDALCIVVLLAAWSLLTVWSWTQPQATRVRIYQAGKVFAELDLQASHTLHVTGPLGDTVIEVAMGRARIVRDPSPRQYCVQAGWLQQAGQSAICLPNQTSIELIGNQPRPYDSLSY